MIHLARRIKDYCRQHTDLVFVQVGAHDGVRADPIRRFVCSYHWVGLLIEPIPQYFEKLRFNYSREKQLLFANYAVSHKKGTMTLYGVGDSAPWWMWQFARTRDSFSRKVFLHNSWYMPGLSQHVVKKIVPADTLHNILTQYQLGHIHLFVIDVEGYDFSVVKQIDILSDPPEFIYYEHRHLSPEDQTRAWDYLTRHGYMLETDIYNTLAYKR